MNTALAVLVECITDIGVELKHVTQHITQHVEREAFSVERILMLTLSASRSTLNVGKPLHA